MKRKAPVDVAIAVSAVAAAVYHLAYSQWPFMGSVEAKSVHLGLALLIVFLTALRKASRFRLPLLLLLLGSMVAVAYRIIFAYEIETHIHHLTPGDMVVGIVLLVAAFEACRQSFGYVIPIVATILILYGVFGHHAPGFLWHPEMSLNEVIAATAINAWGMALLGTLLSVSFGYIFLFVLFAGLLQSTGVIQCFFEFGKLLGRRFRSGAAQAAIVSSALVGTITGQATPNVAVTGAFTIPAMKARGYRSEVAGAIEAAASNGGQIMPPIMSAGAFVMAELLGIPYLKIAVAAVPLAILYFLGVGVFAHLHASKQRIPIVTEDVDVRGMLLRMPLFVIPLGVILVIMARGSSLMNAAFWGIVVLLALSCLEKETRPTPAKLLRGVVQGAGTGAMIGVACASLSPIVAMLTRTGLGITVTASLEGWSGGNMTLALAIAALCVLVLGTEMPTVAAYVIGAIAIAPALTQIGLAPLQAHFFIFYFAACSGLTPPVGASALVASKLANAGYVRTALFSLQAAAAAYIVPFTIGYQPGLLLYESSLVTVLGVLCVAVVGTIALEVGFVGYYLMNIGVLERVVAIGGGVGLLIFLAGGGTVVGIIGFAALLLLTISQIWRGRASANVA